MDSGPDLRGRDEGSSEPQSHMSPEPGGQKRRRSSSIRAASSIDDHRQLDESSNNHDDSEPSVSTHERPGKRPRRDGGARRSARSDTGLGSTENEFDENRERRISTESPRKSHLRTLVIHQVRCEAGNAPTTHPHDLYSHDSHRQLSTYLDRPSLFRGDSGASALRGQDLIDSLQDYLDTREDVGLVVVHTHSCEDYHALHRDKFVRLPRPSDPPIRRSMRGYFQILQEPAPPSTTESENIALSEPLRQALRALGPLDESLVNCHTEDHLVPPYLQLWHSREVIERNIAMGMLDESDMQRISLLMTYIRQKFGAEYYDAEKLFAKGLVSREHLAKLFRPGDVVLKSDEGGEPRCYASLGYPTQRATGGAIWLQCYTWTYDGHFHRANSNISLFWAGGRNEYMPISKLSMYPLRFDLTGTLEKTLTARGRMFWACRERCFVGYEAPSSPFEIQQSNMRYMVDMGTYRELHEKNNASRDGSGGDALIRREEPPDDPFLLLLPSKIMGFGLHDKKWRTLLVKHMHPVKWNKKAFEQLVLEPQKKELVEAMVTIHKSSDLSTDVIEGKGKGLIILLHGGPGTGKTLTAESVAELAERPLYRVTCGDIGTDPEGVEKYLESVLYIGSIWKAVLLLDESDVFLEAREKADLEKNALVSVFLRVLEYYQGILILTSNRVGHFDEAFQSRVQLSLHYPPLDEKGRWQIWDNFFKILQKQQESAETRPVLTLGGVGLVPHERFNIEELRDKIDILAKERLNGRQIRNAITSARQLARFHNRPLGYSYLDQTIRVVRDFECYVEKTHGHTAGGYARATGTRLE